MADKAADPSLLRVAESFEEFYRREYSNMLKLANADGKGVKKVAPAGYNHPSWSPHYTWLALTRYTNQSDRDAVIVVRSIDGSTEKRLTTGGYESQPAFSPVAR